MLGIGIWYTAKCVVALGIGNTLKAVALGTARSKFQSTDNARHDTTARSTQPVAISDEMSPNGQLI